jgi:hypothetical protein
MIAVGNCWGGKGFIAELGSEKIMPMTAQLARVANKSKAVKISQMDSFMQASLQGNNN